MSSFRRDIGVEAAPFIESKRQTLDLVTYLIDYNGKYFIQSKAYRLRATLGQQMVAFTVGANRLESFEELFKKAAEGGAETHPEAAEALLQWHQKRSNTRVIEQAMPL